MKKIIPGLILIILLALVVVPMVVNVQAATTTTGMVTSCTIKTADVKNLTECSAVPASASYDEWAICCIMDRIYMITNWIFLLLMALAVIFVLYGGFLIIAAGGSDERVLKGRSYIMWALVGFAVAILAKALPMIAYYFVK
jgi:hypothetical protein